MEYIYIVYQLVGLFILSLTPLLLKKFTYKFPLLLLIQSITLIVIVILVLFIYFEKDHIDIMIKMLFDDKKSITIQVLMPIFFYLSL